MTEYEKKQREKLLQYFHNMSDEESRKSTNNLVNYWKSAEKEIDLQGLSDKLDKLDKQEKEEFFLNEMTDGEANK